jgi:hypothetical protein
MSDADIEVRLWIGDGTRWAVSKEVPGARHTEPGRPINPRPTRVFFVSCDAMRLYEVLDALPTLDAATEIDLRRWLALSKISGRAALDDKLLTAVDTGDAPAVELRMRQLAFDFEVGQEMGVWVARFWNECFDHQAPGRDRSEAIVHAAMKAIQDGLPPIRH